MVLSGALCGALCAVGVVLVCTLVCFLLAALLTLTMLVLRSTACRYDDITAHDDATVHDDITATPASGGSASTVTFFTLALTIDMLLPCFFNA